MGFYPNNIPGHVLNFLNDSIAAALQFFSRLMGATEMTSFYLAMLFVFIVGRFILVPLFGVSAGSDVARKYIKKEMKSSQYQGKYLKKGK